MLHWSGTLLVRKMAAGLGALSEEMLAEGKASNSGTQSASGRARSRAPRKGKVKMAEHWDAGMVLQLALPSELALDIESASERAAESAIPRLQL